MSAILCGDNFFYGLLDYGNRLVYAESVSLVDVVDRRRFYVQILQFLTERNIALRKAKIAANDSSFTWVPRELYSAEHMDTYARNTFTRNSLRPLELAASAVTEFDAFCVYGLSKQDQVQAGMAFDGVTWHHFQTAFASRLLANLPSSNGVFVHILEQDLNLVVVQDGRIVLSNHHVCDAPEDFLYFIALAYQTFDLSRDEVALCLSGGVRAESDLHQLFARYIRHIRFIESPILLKPNAESMLSHYYFGLHCVSKCA